MRRCWTLRCSVSSVRHANEARRAKAQPGNGLWLWGSDAIGGSADAGCGAGSPRTPPPTGAAPSRPMGAVKSAAAKARRLPPQPQAGLLRRLAPADRSSTRAEAFYRTDGSAFDSSPARARAALQPEAVVEPPVSPQQVRQRVQTAAGGVVRRSTDTTHATRRGERGPRTPVHQGQAAARSFGRASGKRPTAAASPTGLTLDASAPAPPAVLRGADGTRAGLGTDPVEARSFNPPGEAGVFGGADRSRVVLNTHPIEAPSCNLPGEAGVFDGADRNRAVLNTKPSRARPSSLPSPPAPPAAPQARSCNAPPAAPRGGSGGGGGKLPPPATGPLTPARHHSPQPRRAPPAFELSEAAVNGAPDASTSRRSGAARLGASEPSSSASGLAEARDAESTQNPLRTPSPAGAAERRLPRELEEAAVKATPDAARSRHSDAASPGARERSSSRKSAGAAVSATQRTRSSIGTADSQGQIPSQAPTDAGRTLRPLGTTSTTESRPRQQNQPHQQHQQHQQQQHQHQQHQQQHQQHQHQQQQHQHQQQQQQQQQQQGAAAEPDTRRDHRPAHRAAVAADAGGARNLLNGRPASAKVTAKLTDEAANRLLRDVSLQKGMALANTGRARKLDAFRVRWHEVVSRGARVGPQCLATAAAFFTRAGQPQEGIALFDAVTRGDPSIPLRRPTYEAVAHAFAALGDVAGAVAVRKAMVAALPAAAWGSSPKMALILLHALQTRLRLLPETRGAVARAAAAVVDDEERRSAMGQDPPDARIYLDAIPCSASIGAAEALVVRMRRTCLLRARPVSHAPGEPGRASAKHILLEDTGAIPPLLHLCASLRDEDAAARYFDGIVSGEVKYSRKVVAAMMKVHVATGNIDAATDLLRTATGEYKLDTGFAYYVLLIRACAEAARKDVQRDGGGDEARRHVALAETYFRSAFIATSEDSHEQSTALWRAMLAAYAAVGDVAAARDLLVRMEAGNIPTRLVAVKQHMLNAYSAAGLHDEAAKLSAEILQQRLESQERAPQLPLVLRPRADP